VTLAAVTDSLPVGPDSLTVNSEGNVALVSVTIDGNLIVNADNDNDTVAATLTAGPLTTVVGSIALTSGTEDNDTAVLNGAISAGTTFSVTEGLALISAGTITAGTGQTYAANVSLVTDLAASVTGVGDIVFLQTVDTSATAAVGAGDLALDVSDNEVGEDVSFEIQFVGNVGQSGLTAPATFKVGLGSGVGPAITITDGDTQLGTTSDIIATLRGSLLVDHAVAEPLAITGTSPGRGSLLQVLEGKEISAATTSSGQKDDNYRNNKK
jgi:hypothetical protein